MSPVSCSGWRSHQLRPVFIILKRSSVFELMKNPLFLLVLFIASMASAAVAQKPARKFGLEAISPKFWKLISRDAKLETVASGFGFTEGPVWDKAGFLYVSDEEINKIFRVYVRMAARKNSSLSAIPTAIPTIGKEG